MPRGLRIRTVALWVLLAVLVGGGIAQRVKGNPAPVVKRYEKQLPLVQSAAAQSYAEQVVFAYLSWDPDDETVRGDRLKRLGAPDTFSPSQEQLVIYAQAGRTELVNKVRAFVYVDTLLQRSRGETNVTVAVPVTGRGDKLGLFAQPTLLPGSSYPQRERVGVEDTADQKTREALTSAAESFFKLAATTNDRGRLSYFAAKGKEVHGIAALPGSTFVAFDETQFETHGDTVNAYIAARIKDPSGDELTGSYYLTFVQQDGRWLIEQQTP